MDAQQFLAEFGHIADAPGGVARLRELVLQLAISGRLSERVPGDASAGALIELNRERRNALVAQKAIKRQLDPRQVAKGEQPWVLPDGWAWTRLGYVTNYGDSPKIEFEDVNEETWVLELEDIEKGTSKLLSKVLARERKFKSTKNGFPAGAVLYGKLRPYLDKVLIADSAGVCTTEISPISFFENIEAGYLRWYLKSPYFISYANGSTYGLNLPRLGTDSAREALFPFPPQREQSRIVAKVDELMTLCDQFEAQQKERRKLQNALRQSTVKALVSAQSPHELQDSWQRLHANFGRLFREPEDIDALRATVLDLAVAGYLSEESPDDESVDQFVLRSREAKARRLASGEMKRKTAGATDVIQLDLVVPEHWTRISLDELFQFIDYRGKTPTKTESGVVLVTAKNVRPGRLNREPIEYISEKSYSEWMTRGFPRIGDLLFTTEAPLGNVALIEDQPNFALAQRIIDLQPFADLNTRCAMYFVLSPTFQDLLERNSTGMTAKGIKAAKLKQLEIPVPPVPEQARIVVRVKQLMRLCDELEKQLRDAGKTAERLTTAAIAALTGITLEQEEETPVKAPQTELIAPLCLGVPPDVKVQAPLATILARHNGAMSARDLWQRFGGEIDAFYAQLNTEVAHGWIDDPSYVLDARAPDSPKKYPDGAQVAKMKIKEGA
ncbi:MULTISPECIES: restriction endonuclease subunit S [Burkholderia]|uniref:restriction endonuclease subunit S n=2 Tax=Burkholderiaceae TaxID=119060 RepID=UPI00158BF7F5|nr:restriction endonuclease subunit S [Burkholderia ambifaria]